MTLTQFSAGFYAPFVHVPALLLLLGLGLWAGRVGGRELPMAAFAAVIGLLAGAGLAAVSVMLPSRALVVAGLLISVGLVVAFDVARPALLVVVAAAAAGLFLGQGPAGPSGVAPLHWLGVAVGALTATATGIGFLPLTLGLGGPQVLRLAGFGLAAVGLLILLGII